ncbi:MAG: TonB-dependent receptor plug domain-containing protein [Bacteroidales bacterium]
MRVILSFSFLVLIHFSNLAAQDDTTSITGKVFELGEVSVTASKPETELSVVRKSEMTKRNLNDVAESLAILPGINITNIGARNENTIYLRGYDSRQVSLLIDGIPVYIPYDGNIDLGRFLNWNYEKITVSKGFSSLLYGPNTMGGAINLVTAVPEGKLELNARAEVIFGNTGYNGNLQNLRVGSKLDKLFLQGTFTRRQLEGWDLSEKFEVADLQEEGRRLNSDEHDLGFSLRVGFTPNENDSYVITYAHHEGSKGIPVYDGTFRKRYWRMPEWDKSSLYFNSNTAISKNTEIVSRIYYDNFENTLESFDDESFSSQERNYAFTSYYDDYSLGGSVKLKNRAIKSNELAFALIYKYDNHRESTPTPSDPIIELADNTFSIALEDKYDLSRMISLTGGLSWNLRANSTAREYYEDNSAAETQYPSEKDQAINYRLGINFNLSPHQLFWFNNSLSSRFATMKERYSFRMGQSLPNPDLGSERAHHFNLGYRISYGKMRITTELFYSMGKNKIAYVNIDPETIQFQNIERTRSLGLDTELYLQLLKNLKFRIDYSYLHLENTEDPEFYFVNSPEHSLGIFGEYSFMRIFSLNLYYRYLSGQYSYTDGTYPLDDYCLTSLNLIAELIPSFALRFSIRNLFDVNYFFADGYPGRGRTFSFSLMFNL